MTLVLLPDVAKLFREWLLTSDDLTALLPVRSDSGSIYAAQDLPDYVDVVNDGPAITVFSRSGQIQAEAPLAKDSLQVKVWSKAFGYEEARVVYRTLEAFCHGQNNITLSNGTILSCLCGTRGQDVTDPDTGWATVLSFFEVMVRN